MVRPKSLFEREDSGKLQVVEVMIVFGVIFMLSWLSVNAPTAVKDAVNSLTFMVILITIIFVLDKVSPKNTFFESIGLGLEKDVRKGALAGLIFALIYIFVISGGSAAMIVPFAATGFAFLALPVAIVEEMFFRSTLIPTVARLFSNFPETFRGLHDWVAVGFGSVAFGLFHFYVYNASFELMLAAILFGLVLVLGNYVFKTTGFSYTAHFTYNFVVVFIIGMGLV